jgi:hypothetical protein
MAAFDRDSPRRHAGSVCEDRATNFVLQEFSDTDEMLFEAKGKRGPTTPSTRSCNEHMRRRSPTLRALASPGRGSALGAVATRS